MWNEIIATPLEILGVERADEAVITEIGDFQKAVAARHAGKRERLIGMGGQPNTTPYNRKPLVEEVRVPQQVLVDLSEKVCYNRII